MKGNFGPPRKDRMTHLGQTATFSTAWRCVGNATVNRHSIPNVGNAPVSGPKPGSR